MAKNTKQVSLMQQKFGKLNELPKQLVKSQFGFATDENRLFIGNPEHPTLKERYESNTFPYGNVEILTEFSELTNQIKYSPWMNGKKVNYPITVLGNNEVTEIPVGSSIIINDNEIEFTNGGVVVTDYDYLVLRYIWTDGRDLDTDTRIINAENVPLINNLPIGWSRGTSVPTNSSITSSIMYWSGDNTGEASEEHPQEENILITKKNINESEYYGELPTNIQIELQGTWYSSVGNNPVKLEIMAYKGGVMTTEGYRYVNNGGEQIKFIDEHGDEQDSLFIDVENLSDTLRVYNTLGYIVINKESGETSISTITNESSSGETGTVSATINLNEAIKQINDSGVNVEARNVDGKLQLKTIDDELVLENGKTIGETSILDIFGFDKTAVVGVAPTKRILQDVLDDRYSVKSFDVKGNNTTNDGEQINKALEILYDYNKSDPKELYFPADRYLVNDISLNLYTNTHLVGEGIDRTIIRTNSNTNPLLKIADGIIVNKDEDEPTPPTPPTPEEPEIVEIDMETTLDNRSSGIVSADGKDIYDPHSGYAVKLETGVSRYINAFGNGGYNTWGSGYILKYWQNDTYLCIAGNFMHGGLWHFVGGSLMGEETSEEYFGNNLFYNNGQFYKKDPITKEKTYYTANFTLPNRNDSGNECGRGVSYGNVLYHGGHNYGWGVEKSIIDDENKTITLQGSIYSDGSFATTQLYSMTLDGKFIFTHGRASIGYGYNCLCLFRVENDHFTRITNIETYGEDLVEFYNQPSNVKCKYSYNSDTGILVCSKDKKIAWFKYENEYFTKIGEYVLTGEYSDYTIYNANISNDLNTIGSFIRDDTNNINKAIIVKNASVLNVINNTESSSSLYDESDADYSKYITTVEYPHNIMIEGITFDISSSFASELLKLKHCSDVTFRNCKFICNTNGNIVNTISDCNLSNIKFEDCIFEGNNSINGSIIINGSLNGLLITNCEFKNIKNTSIKLYGNEYLIQNGIIGNNKFTNCGETTNNLIYTNNKTRYISIVKSLVDQNVLMEENGYKVLLSESELNYCDTPIYSTDPNKFLRFNFYQSVYDYVQVLYNKYGKTALEVVSSDFDNEITNYIKLNQGTSSNNDVLSINATSQTGDVEINMGQFGDLHLGKDSDNIEEWMPNHSYNALELMYYEGLLYRCLVDHISSEDIHNDSNKWVQTNSKIIPNWYPLNAYTSKDFVIYNDIAYICNTSHTSEGVFNLEYWDEIGNVDDAIVLHKSLDVNGNIIESKDDSDITIKLNNNAIIIDDSNSDIPYSERIGSKNNALVNVEYVNNALNSGIRIKLDNDSINTRVSNENRTDINLINFDSSTYGDNIYLKNVSLNVRQMFMPISEQINAVNPNVCKYLNWTNKISTGLPNEYDEGDIVEVYNPNDETFKYYRCIVEHIATTSEASEYENFMVEFGLGYWEEISGALKYEEYSSMGFDYVTWYKGDVVKFGDNTDYEEFTNEFGKFVNAECTIARSADRSSWVYTLGIHFENGVLPIWIDKDGTEPEIDLNLFEENGDSRYNGGCFVDQTLVNSIATDQAGGMIWASSENTRIDAYGFDEAVQNEWEPAQGTTRSVHSLSMNAVISDNGNTLTIYKNNEIFKVYKMNTETDVKYYVCLEEHDASVLSNDDSSFENDVYNGYWKEVSNSVNDLKYVSIKSVDNLNRETDKWLFSIDDVDLNLRNNNGYTYPLWQPNTEYQYGDIVRFNYSNFKCIVTNEISSHVSGSSQIDLHNSEVWKKLNEPGFDYQFNFERSLLEKQENEYVEEDYQFTHNFADHTLRLGLYDKDGNDLTMLDYDNSKYLETIDWQPNTVYYKSQYVKYNGNTYVVQNTFASGNSFNSDNMKLIIRNSWNPSTQFYAEQYIINNDIMYKVKEDYISSSNIEEDISNNYLEIIPSKYIQIGTTGNLLITINYGKGN